MLEAHAVLYIREGSPVVTKPGATLTREVSKENTGLVRICVAGANDQRLTAHVDALEFLNAVKIIFPELLINLPT